MGEQILGDVMMHVHAYSDLLDIVSSAAFLYSKSEQVAVIEPSHD